MLFFNLRQPHKAGAIPYEEELFSDIYRFLKSRKLHYDPFEHCQYMVDQESSLLSQYSYHLKESIVLQPPATADPYTTMSKFQQGRLLLTHFGFLLLEILMVF